MILATQVGCPGTPTAILLLAILGFVALIFAFGLVYEAVHDYLWLRIQRALGRW